MATNLRLNERTAEALRAAAAKAGRSQQDLIREALDRYLGLDARTTDLERMVASGLVKAPTPLENFEPFLDLPDGMTVLDLLDRDER